MAKRRVKKRTHVGASLPKNTVKPNDGAPKSMVIRVGAGEVGSSVSQLVKDMRSVMEPGTATRLKERKSNKLRDYTTMAGPLGVTHLMLFSKSASGNTNLRLTKTPRGPTLHFRVEKYSLCKDVQRSQKHPRTSGHEYHMAPLLVMNNFTSATTAPAEAENPIPKHLESLTTTMFQSLFPPISPQATPLTSIRRVLLLNREPAPADSPNAYIINLRHYAITTRAVARDVPKSLRRLDGAAARDRKRRPLPNLGRLEDAADYLLDPDAAGGGYTSASETEVETDAEVEVLTTTRKVLNRKEKQRAAEARQAGGSRGTRSGGGDGSVEKKAVKLVELGPRLRLRLQKVEEGLCGGKVMWHEHITKTAEEVRAMDKVWDQRRQEKEERRRIQKENVEKKKKEKKARGEDGGDEDDDDEVDYDEDMSDAWDSEGLDDEGAGDGGDEDEDMEDDE